MTVKELLDFEHHVLTIGGYVRFYDQNTLEPITDIDTLQNFRFMDDDFLNREVAQINAGIAPAKEFSKPDGYYKMRNHYIEISVY